jgi:hypothetical protein
VEASANKLRFSGMSDPLIEAIRPEIRNREPLGSQPTTKLPFPYQ